MSENLLTVNNLKKYFSTGAGTVHAVDDISFNINKQETLGLVGESGCGKSTTGRTVIRLIEPTAGEIIYNNKNIADLNKKELRQIRREMQIIFQDPYSSLDPRKSIGDTIGKPLQIHKFGTKKEIEDKVDELMKKVGLSPDIYNKYPHELDGGRRQRVGIARALSLNPNFIVCDEPVSALDVSIQAQILNLLEELQHDMDLTFLFIAHDLSVIKHISTRIAVMYLGKIVEIAPKNSLFKNPVHPYTKALLSAVPIPKLNRRHDRIILEGAVPSPINPPSGCSFHPRCKEMMPICKEIDPAETIIGEEHRVNCHLVG